MKDIFITCVLLASTFSVCAQIKIGDHLPDIKVPNQLNQEISITNFQGKVILVDFWASWCAPCRKANKKLVDLHREYAPAKLEIVGISVDTDRSKWLKAITKDNIEYTQLTDPHGFEAKSAIQFGVEALPASFLFDPNGKLIAINPTEKEIKQQLNHNKK